MIKYLRRRKSIGFVSIVDKEVSNGEVWIVLTTETWTSENDLMRLIEGARIITQVKRWIINLIQHLHGQTHKKDSMYSPFRWAILPIEIVPSPFKINTRIGI